MGPDYLYENLFDSFIADKGMVILDGAMATELESRGADLNHGLWSAKLLTEDPQLIQEVYYDYLMAGTDVITTASYQASFEGFAKYGYTNQQVIELMRLSVVLAVTARADSMKIIHLKVQLLIAASVIRLVLCLIIFLLRVKGMVLVNNKSSQLNLLKSNVFSIKQKTSTK